MHTANKQFYTPLCTLLRVVVLVFVMSFFVPVSAHAQTLVVDFESDPLFNVTDFSPGDSTEGDVTVENGSEESQDVYVEAINIVDPEEFSKILNLLIFDDGTTYYDGSFWDFLVGGPQALSTLSADASNTFTFVVSFGSGEAENQESTLGFDLCVGFSGGESNCGDTVISPEIDDDGEGGTIPGGGGGSGGGNGGGGNTSVQVLIVQDERVISMAPESGLAIIGWETNKLATSQVIYGPASGTYVLDLNSPPFFGYPLGTVESPTKTLSHVVEITGLTLGEVYKYRVVSRASPPTISKEQQFVFADEGTSVFAGTQGAPDGSGVGSDADFSDGAIGTAGNSTGGAGTTTGTANEERRINNLAAALSGIPGWLLDALVDWWWLLLIFALLFFFFFWFMRRRKEDEENQTPTQS